MKFLLWGGRGWIGGQLGQVIEASGHEAVLATSRADDPTAVAAELDSVQPDRCVSLIGRTRGEGIATIDYLEGKGKLRENVRDNLFSPLVLAHCCRERDIHLTYLGTGCIFEFDGAHTLPARGGASAGEGSAAVGFTEDDDPNFFGSQYSVVKGFTDRLMRLLHPKRESGGCVLNVRIRMPITADDSPYNFVAKIVNYDRVIDIPNSMTVLPELLPIFLDLSIRKESGTINLTNPGAISHNEVLALYKQHVDPSYEWRNFSIEEQDAILSSGRSNNLLDTSRLQALYPNVAPIHEAIARLCASLKKNCPAGILTKKRSWQ